MHGQREWKREKTEATTFLKTGGGAKSRWELI
jgi:hypothetical protein